MDQTRVVHEARIGSRDRPGDLPHGGLARVEREDPVQQGHDQDIPDGYRVRHRCFTRPRRR